MPMTKVNKGKACTNINHAHDISGGVYMEVVELSTAGRD